MKGEDQIQNLLADADRLHAALGDCKVCNPWKEGERTDFLALYRVEEVTYEEKAPRKEALENVISSMNIEGLNFIYLIMGDQEGVRFYYGVSRDNFLKTKPILEVNDAGEAVLKPSLQGNFRGSSITEVTPNEKRTLLKSLDGMKRIRVLQGVPGINEDDEKFQSVDRVIDVMLGDEFAFLLVAKPMDFDEMNTVRDRVYSLYDAAMPLAKVSIQESSGTNEGSSESFTEGKSDTEGTNRSKTEQHSVGVSTAHTEGSSSGKSIGKNKGVNTSFTTGKNAGSSYSVSKEKGKGDKQTVSDQKSEGTQESTQTGTQEGTQEGAQEGTNQSDTKTESETGSTSKTQGDSVSKTTNTSKTTGTQTGSNTGNAQTTDVVAKRVQEWLKYIDETILPRIDYGAGKGLFLASVVLLGKEEASVIKLENAVRSVYGGETGNRISLQTILLKADSDAAHCFRRMQIPRFRLKKALTEDEMNIRTASAQVYEDPQTMLPGSWMSSKELSLYAGLPQKEVVGLALHEEVEFGLNVKDHEADSSILLGHLVQSGTVFDGENGLPQIKVLFDKRYFDKHIFVTGVTGSGKTTTCQKLLLESGENFLVIEPAKTEYRVLMDQFEDLLVFTLGKESGAPFRLNPFEFFPGENITSRVDMIKASMEAAFDMEAAIPQLLEAAIYDCYEDRGWDISTNRNSRYPDPFAGGVPAFPTLGDLEKKIEGVVTAQGFGDRLRDEYIGSIRARLKGLTVGSKGLMLNTPRSVSFVELLDRKVVLELENVRNASEKSLIMGFILINLSEAVKLKYSESKRQIEHLTLVEEAHRLLGRYMPGDSMNKKQGVEMFSDMLAEVRKYGESLIVADQIPEKLTPEVLKNTNTKIVHKIFAQDDKDAIGNIMALKDEQKEYLSYLEAGRAVMTHPGLGKAIQVKILQTAENDTNRVPPEDDKLRERILSFYASAYRQGIIPGLEALAEEPDRKTVDLCLEYLQPNGSFMKELWDFSRSRQAGRCLLNTIGALREQAVLTDAVRILYRVWNPDGETLEEDSIAKASACFELVAEKGQEMQRADFSECNILEELFPWQKRNR